MVAQNPWPVRRTRDSPSTSSGSTRWHRSHVSISCIISRTMPLWKWYSSRSCVSPTSLAPRISSCQHVHSAVFPSPFLACLTFLPTSVGLRASRVPCASSHSPCGFMDSRRCGCVCRVSRASSISRTAKPSSSDASIHQSPSKIFLLGAPSPFTHGNSKLSIMEMSSLVESLPPNADGTHGVHRPGDVPMGMHSATSGRSCHHDQYHVPFVHDRSRVGVSCVCDCVLGGLVYRGVVVIKPDAYEAMGKIIDAFIKQGFIMSRMRMLRLSQDQADAFYSRNRGDAQAAYAVSISRARSILCALRIPCLAIPFVHQAPIAIVV
jgi:hypothetical protein